MSAHTQSFSPKATSAGTGDNGGRFDSFGRGITCRHGEEAGVVSSFADARSSG